MANKKQYKERIEALRKMIAVQELNLNNSEIQVAMYNGMVFALSIMENSEPVYREVPKNYVMSNEEVEKEAQEAIEFYKSVGVYPEQLTMDEQLMQHKEDPWDEEIQEQKADNSSPTKYFG